jgi:hypothetical protein
MKKAAVVLVMLTAIVTSVFAQKPAVVTSNEPGWRKIGEITASFKMENESIVVLGADEFTSIKLKVKDAPINIEHVQVFYESGDMEEIEVKDELQAGAETRVINLKNRDRDIQKVAFTYKTLPNYNGDKADVELYGLKSGQPEGKDAYREEKAERDIEKAANEVEEEAEEAGEKAENEAQTVEEGVKESAAIVEAEIKDQVYADKVGPDGEVIYIDKHAKFYYISREGKKISITKMQMKDKPKKD